jgi:hypothetical protein
MLRIERKKRRQGAALRDAGEATSLGFFGLTIRGVRYTPSVRSEQLK